ncbi:hypothetical protein [Cesiribacter sp. SM1]|nr:hypothetical protein [Cesiribacter sp. SM1]
MKVVDLIFVIHAGKTKRLMRAREWKKKGSPFSWLPLRIKL